ncbi:MAG TPA: von Willebrand factor type A domain-containing protein [Chthoniobacter sp.]|nr:von Willebrand factor type A domain-containing protein [Chthoniobacter sp.]
MNDPQKKPTPREELEMRLTSLLLGELPPEEAAALEAQVAADPVLAVLQTRLRKAMELVREASKEPEAPVSETPVQLSGERRAQLLAHFKTARPKPPQTVKLARFPRLTEVKEKRERDWSWVIPLGVAATVVGLVVFGLGDRVVFKAATDAPDFAAYSDTLSVDVANHTAMPPEEPRGYAYQPAPAEPTLQAPAGNPATMSPSLAAITTSKMAAPTFQIDVPAAKVPSAPAAPSIATMAPAKVAIRGQVATGGTASPVGHAMSVNKGWAESDAASPAAGGAAAPVPDRSTIYLGKTLADNAAAGEDASKMEFATAGGAGVVVTKSGSGNLILSGSNTYSGGTRISGGTLSLNGDFDAGTGSIADQSAAVGALSGTGGVTVQSGNGVVTLRETTAAIDGRTLNVGKDVFLGGGVVGTSQPNDRVEFTRREKPSSAPMADEKEMAQASSASNAVALKQQSAGEKITGNTRTPKDALASNRPVKERLKEMSDLVEANQLAENKPAAATAIETKAKAKAATPGGQTANQLLAESQQLYDTGRLGLAKKRAEQALAADPASQAARKLDEKIGRATTDYGVTAYNETRADAIPKTALAWARPVRRSADPDKDGFKNEDEYRSETDPNNRGANGRTSTLRSKLDRIIIPKVEFHDATVREAIDFLKKKSVEFDDKSPAGERGTNIVLKLGDASGKDVPGIPGLQTPPAAAPDGTAPTEPRITVSLKDIPLGEALKYVTGLANLKYKVEPYAISVVPQTENTDPMITKEWKVPADLIPNATDANGTVDREVAKNWLAAQGLSFNGAASAVYIPKSSRLVVRNTQDQLDRVDNIVSTSVAEKAEAATKTAPSAMPVPQPEVETRANPFSTFSLNVSDVSFKLAAASLEQNGMPDAATVRSEEFINAFDYRDPEPAPGAPLAFATERARYPFAQNRDLLRFSVKTAAAGRQPGRPLNIVLLLDKSGSMERADRVNIVREALRVLATQLQPQDKLSIVTFARTPRLWADGVAGDKVADTIARVNEITPEGGTNLEAALDLGYATALRHYTVGSINRVVLFTDGAANLGDIDPDALTKKVEEKRKKGVALDCFGIGWEGFNDDLLEQLTRNADGRYGFINTPEEAAENFAMQLAGALRVAASDVKVQVEFNPRRVKAYRQVGYAKHQLTKEQFRDNTVNAAQIGAAESGNALYVVEVDPRGEGDLATVRVRFRDPGTSDYHEHEWAVPFTGDVPPLEQASSALRLAGAASAFSEMLANNPFAAEVTSERLLNILSGVPPIYGADPRPMKLEWMIRQVRSVSNR